MSHTTTILIVDDEPLGRETLNALLQPQGYRLEFAAAGPEALEQAQAHLPDLILLDVMMPGMDGFEVCRRLRASPQLREVPVILLTALDDRASRLQGIEAGADDFITKPFDRIELRARVRTITRLNRYQHLLHERARFEWVIEHADDGYLIITDAGAIRYANPQARHYLGVEPDADLGQTMFLDLVDSQYRCNPYTDWPSWIAEASGQASPHYLVRPPSPTTTQFMLEANLLAITPYPVDGHIVRLRDISETMVNQHAIWSFQGLVRHKFSTALSQVLGSLQILESLDLVSDVGTATEFLAMASHGAQDLQQQLQGIFQYIDTPDLIRPEGGSCTISDAISIMSNLCRNLKLPDLAVDNPQHEQVEALQLGISTGGIELILGELVRNARKFHPQKSPAISMAFRHQNDSITLSLSDDGITLSPDQLTNVWLPYYQGERYFTGQVPGMGLGLPMVATLIWRAGGACRLTNRVPGPGVQVELTIPAVNAENQAAYESVLSSLPPHHAA
jgi:two-component system, cell cycle response regulator